MEGHVQAARDRDLPAGQPLGRRRVVLQHVPDLARLPGSRADRVPRAARLQRGQLADVRVDLGGEGAQQPGPVAGRHGPPGLLGRRGPADGGVRLLGGGLRDVGDRLLRRGLSTVYCVMACSPLASGRPEAPPSLVA